MKAGGFPLKSGGVVCRWVCVFSLLMFVQACAQNGGRLPTNDADAAQYNAQLGAQYLRRGDLDQALEKLTKALNQDDSNALAHVTYAQLQFQVDKPDSAKKHFKLALELEPDEAEYRNSYGIYLCKVQSYKMAQQQFRAAAENPYYKTPEFALDNAGLCMLDADRLTDAETYLREALRVNPKFGNAYLHMSELMFRQQRLTVAEAYFDRYKVYGTESSESLWLGYKINRDAGDPDGARNFANRLLDQFPSSSEAGEYLTQPQ
ncbi:MAG: type IV pilus assembly protein PilF [Granulosicoccus sp.]|jgi:type IV pilus assembly protein PilF